MHAARRRVSPPPPLRAMLPRVLGLGLLLAAGCANAATAEAWLARMQAALLELDYVGEFTYLRDGRLSSLALAHAVEGGVQRERLVHLDGPVREIVRTGEAVVCILGDDDPMLDHLDRMPAGPFARAFLPGDGGLSDGIPDHYHAIAGGTGRIARLPAVRIEVRPDDASRYGIRLWLHEDSALPLRAELLSARDAPLEVFQFVRLEIGATLTDDDLAATTAPGLVRHALERDASEAVVEAAAWEAAWLPAGFRMAASAARPGPGAPAGQAGQTEQTALHTLRYTDGLASVSVFVEAARAEASWVHTRRQGATSAVLREVELPGEGRFLVTVVGEVPMETAEHIARTVRPLVRPPLEVDGP